MNRTILLTFILVALLGQWPAEQAWSYTSYEPLLYLDSDGDPVLGSSNTITYNFSSKPKTFTIHNRASQSDNFNKDYFGYTSTDFSGYYIGTIKGNTDSGNPEPFDFIIGYYLNDSKYSVTQLKVDSPSGNSGSKSSSDTTLTVTWKPDFKSGTWSLTNAYGFGFYAVKGGPEFALYFVDPAQSSGNWTTRHLLNKGGNIPAISHFSGAPTQMPVPEPTTLLLLGAGLLGIGFVGRRRSGR